MNLNSLKYRMAKRYTYKGIVIESIDRFSTTIPEGQNKISKSGNGFDIATTECKYHISCSDNKLSLMRYPPNSDIPNWCGIIVLDVPLDYNENLQELFVQFKYIIDRIEMSEKTNYKEQKFD